VPALRTLGKTNRDRSPRADKSARDRPSIDAGYAYSQRNMILSVSAFLRHELAALAERERSYIKALKESTKAGMRASARWRKASPQLRF
jgi:hypothetical protein